MLNIFLELARGFAAVWVFLFHVNPMIHRISPTIETFAADGQLGVPLFFVISGYCLYSATSASVKHQKPPSTFLRRRFLRIYPPFWASLFVVVAMPYLLEFLSSLKTGQYIAPTPKFLAWGVAEWLQLVTLARIFFDTAHDFPVRFNPVNSVYWTLALEFQFYLVLLAALFFKQHWRKFLLGVFGVSLLVFGIEPIRNSGVFLPFWPAFACGLGLRWLYETERTPARVFGASAGRITNVLIAVMLTALLWFIMRPSVMIETPISGGMRTIETLFAAYCAALFWLLGDLEARLTSKGIFRADAATMIGLKPFLLMGAASYSIYLLHGKIYQLPEMLVRQVLAPTNVLYPVAIIGITITAAYGFYLLFEKPFMSQNYQQRIAQAVRTEPVPANRREA